MRKLSLVIIWGSFFLSGHLFSKSEFKNFKEEFFHNYHQVPFKKFEGYQDKENVRVFEIYERKKVKKKARPLVFVKLPESKGELDDSLENKMFMLMRNREFDHLRYVIFEDNDGYEWMRVEFVDKKGKVRSLGYRDLLLNHVGIFFEKMHKKSARKKNLKRLAQVTTALLFTSSLPVQAFFAATIAGLPISMMVGGTGIGLLALSSKKVKKEKKWKKLMEDSMDVIEKVKDSRANRRLLFTTEMNLDKLKKEVSKFLNALLKESAR